MSVYLRPTKPRTAETSLGTNGENELVNNENVNISKVENKKYKTEICVNHKQEGSGICPYGDVCVFLHKGDEQFEKRLEFEVKRQSHVESIQKLHADLAKATEELAKATGKLAKQKQALRDKIYNEIGRKVREWNNPHPNGPYYYDVHGMTQPLLAEYIQEIIAKMEMSNVHQAKVETGKGNHSPYNFPALKTFLVTEYPRGMFVPDENNSGVLILTLEQSCSKIE
ncbi:hypothetical protein B9Z55_007522 [Caenorhabditis nigoni]|uniref:C3H1-type domain-containing protein n=1 Tax=Caenorhabditis nigoni TaxID=1611254 RepID=A0A2G5VA25_9PELO|nr:hypothetical protein B9Z55_007522 [Caenorhabditis nigoni]